MPPQQARRDYTGPAVPTTYDPLWGLFQNLTPSQVLAFQSFPQDLASYAAIKRWNKEFSTFTVTIGGNTFPVDMSDRGLSRVTMLKTGAAAIVNFYATDGNVYTLSAVQITQMLNAMNTRVQNTYSTLATLLNGINATPATITARSQIDAAFAAIS
jgi:hypothetical protein